MSKVTSPGKIERLVGAREFLNILKNNRDGIYKSEIVSPKLGRPGLGGFKITYKSK